MCVSVVIVVSLYSSTMPEMLSRKFSPRSASRQTISASVLSIWFRCINLYRLLRVYKLRVYNDIILCKKSPETNERRWKDETVMKSRFDRVITAVSKFISANFRIFLQDDMRSNQ